MAYNNPTIADFVLFFQRDFPFGTDPQNNVLDADVAKAFGFTNINVSQALWANQADYTIGYSLLAAHYLVMNLRASSQGINGQFNFLQQSKSVASVAEAFGIPDRIMQNPEWAILCKTNYGAQYLSLLLPQMSGQIYSVCGTTRP